MWATLAAEARSTSTVNVFDGATMVRRRLQRSDTRSSMRRSSRRKVIEALPKEFDDMYQRLTAELERTGEVLNRACRSRDDGVEGCRGAAPTSGNGVQVRWCVFVEWGDRTSLTARSRSAVFRIVTQTEIVMLLLKHFLGVSGHWQL